MKQRDDETMSQCVMNPLEVYALLTMSKRVPPINGT